MLTVPFALRLEGGDPALLDLARNRVAQLQARFKTASGGTGEVRVTGLAKEYAGESKLREPKPWTRLDGCLEIPLADSQDYWARAKLLLAIKGAIDELRSADTETEPRVTIVFDEPQAGIKDVERYREQLTLAWVARMRKFMAAAQSEAAPLEIVDCAPPTDIIEARVSIEEVVLDLKPTCKLDVLARGSERQR